MLPAFETTYFAIPPSRYVRAAAPMWLARWWWTIVLPLLACIVAGLYDLRFFIVALAIVFIVAPGVLMLVYFNYALHPEAAIAVIPHKITSHPVRGITIEYRPEPDSGYRTPATRHIPADTVCTVEDTGAALIIHLADTPRHLLIVPHPAILQK